jgi:hypothetical protein
MVGMIFSPGNSKTHESFLLYHQRSDFTRASRSDLSGTFSSAAQGFILPERISFLPFGKINGKMKSSTNMTEVLVNAGKQQNRIQEKTQ